MTFTYPSLALVGAALAVVPIVIHLLNLRRRRPVQWAAMDFLLESDRKQRTWVKLSEWLLLAARVLAIALAGLLAATPKTADLLDGFFGETAALHLVLLDDTASMKQRDAGTTAWDEATAAVQRLTEQAQQSGDRVVVARYTDQLAERELSTAPNDRAGLATWRASNAAATAAAGLHRLLEEREATADMSRVFAYVFSDFAETSHGELAEWAEPLRKLGRETSELVLAGCGEPAAGNLSIESLRLVPGPVAAGVETRLAIEVSNHSDETAAEVAITIRRDGQPLASVKAGPFEPDRRRRVEIPIALAGVGLHLIEATLPGDRLPIDDRRWLAVETPAAQPVLLVDDSDSAIESRVLAAALRPLGKARSGWAPVRVREPTADSLANAAAVVMMDTQRVSTAAVAALRDYVDSGGGLLWVVGPRTDAELFNRRVAGGLAGQGGLVPWRLGPPRSVASVDVGEPMIRVGQHPAVRVLSGERNGFVPLVRAFVRRRLATDEDAPTLRNASTGSPSIEFETLIGMADGKPLLLESQYGQGRVLGLLTTTATGRDAAPPWSNLATLPIFPVLANDLAGWLAHDRLAPRTEPIGNTQRQPASSGLLRAMPGGDFEPAVGIGAAERARPAEPGVYRRLVGRQPQPAFSAVIDPAESDLRAVDLSTMRSRWNGIARVGRAEDLFRDTPDPASRVPLYAVAAVLLAVSAVERLLAYNNSYVRAGAAT